MNSIAAARSVTSTPSAAPSTLKNVAAMGHSHIVLAPGFRHHQRHQDKRDLEDEEQTQNDRIPHLDVRSHHTPQRGSPPWSPLLKWRVGDLLSPPSSFQLGATRQATIRGAASKRNLRTARRFRRIVEQTCTPRRRSSPGRGSVLSAFRISVFSKTRLVHGLCVSRGRYPVQSQRPRRSFPHPGQEGLSDPGITDPPTTRH